MISQQHTPLSSMFSDFPPISKDRWKEKVLADLKGADFTKKCVWKTLEGFEIDPFYTAEDLQNITIPDALPGEFPYVRGTESSPGWTIQQDIEVIDAQVSNQFARQAIEGGVSSIGFLIANPQSFSNQDLTQLIEDIDFSKVSVHFSAGSESPNLFLSFVDMIMGWNFPIEELSVSLGYDPIGDFATYGIFNPDDEKCFRDIGIMIESLKSSGFYKPVTIQSSPYHLSGASAVQELAYTLAAANETLYKLSNLGLDPATVARHMQFSFDIGSNFFMEIAKLRAARLLWAQIVSAYDGSYPEAQKMTVLAKTTSWNKTVYDPYVNLLRTTTEALSAVIGGCQKLSLLTFDVVGKTPDSFSYRLARNIQHLLKGESYMDKVVDPAAGSYYIETLTDKLAENAWKVFQNIEKEGGFIACLKNGTVQKSIESLQTERKKRLESRKTVFVGVNQYPNLEEQVAESIKRLDLEPETPAAEIETLIPTRGAKAFEACRLATEFFVNKGGKQPVVFLLPIGHLAMSVARSTFSSNFFGCAGFKIIQNNTFKTAEEGVDMAINAKPDFVVVCSSDDEYPSVVAQICSALNAKQSSAKVIVAGYPKEQLDTLTAAGVHSFIHLRTNALEALRNYQKEVGIPS